MEIFILYFNFFFPIFTPFTNSSIGSIILNLNLILFSIYSLVKYKLNFNQSIIKINIFYVFMVIIGLIVSKEKMIFRDFYEFQRPILYIVAFFIGEKFLKKIKSMKEFNRVLENIFNIFIILNILKILNYKNLIFSLYQRNKLFLQPRVSGTFISPYDYAYFLIFPLFFFFEKYLKTQKLKFLFKSIIVLISIICTQSRSQFITLIYSLILYLIYKLIFEKNKREKIRLLRILFIVFFSLGGIVIKFWDKIYLKLGYLISGLQNILNNGITGDPSGQIRYKQMIFAIEEFKKSFFYLGNGPQKLTGFIFENQYILYLYRYGILGIFYNVILMFILFKLAFKLLKCLKISKNNETKIAIVSFSIFIFSTPIAILSNNIIDQIRISFFFYFLIGFYNSILKANKKGVENVYFNNNSSF